MDNSRGRSPSRGSAQHISPQASPNHFQGNVQARVHGVDPSVQQALTGGKFTQQFQAPFLSPDQQPTGLPTDGSSNFYQNNQFSQNTFQDNRFAGQTLDPHFGGNSFLFSDTSVPGDMSQTFSFQNYDMSQQQNVNPADLSKMSSPPAEHQSPGGTNLYPPEAQPPQSHSSQPTSPSSTNGNQYYTPQHSRHASLDPNSAWGDSLQASSFQHHRRAPSDYSDVSSAQHSPNLPHVELDLNAHGSPYLPAQDSTNTFGLDAFTLGDQVQATYRSPRLMPNMDQGQQQTMGLNQDMHLDPTMMQVPDMFNAPTGSYPPLVPSNHMGQGLEMGQADQYTLPAINIEPAPVSRQQSFGPNGEPMEGALSPPSSTRGRNRSKSDVTGLTRPIARSASQGAERSSPSLSNASLTVHSYTPERGRSGSLSRETSPGPVQSGRVDKNRRASTSSMGQNRDYILDLADPNRPNANPSGTSTRVQKHPATFQCTLCPKRFTRAYNLRSHLRTHTDERPFVCTVCGKAFARQHDRKRHEGLHSGEKKFVCKGELRSQPGQHWGCGRRFARADALGRHFRSEAGRICIKPLLEEEKQERQNRAMLEQQQQQQAQFAQQGGLQPVPQPLAIGLDPNAGSGGFMLPAALLAQYPALQNIDWSQIQGGDDPGDLSDVSGMGRGSFDANSNNGEFYEDLSEGYESGLDFSNQQGQPHIYSMGS